MGEVSQQEPTEDIGGHRWASVGAVAHQPVAIIQQTELLLSHPAADILHPRQEILISLGLGGLWHVSGGSAPRGYFGTGIQGREVGTLELMDISEELGWIAGEVAAWRVVVVSAVLHPLFTQRQQG